MKTRTKWLMTSLATLALGAACGDETSGGTDTTGTDTTTTETTVTNTTVTDTATTETTVTDTATTETTVTDTATTDTATTDTTVTDTTTTDTTTTDTTTDTDTDTDTVEVTCDYSGFEPTTEGFQGDETGAGYEGDTDAEFLRISFFTPVDGSSDVTPLTGPGDYVIGGSADDENYETCTTCVIAARDCTADGCAKIFYATSGTIHVTELDYATGVFVGSLEDAKLVEVTIDDTTYRSTPVDGGEGWCLDTFAFSAKPECSTSDDCTADPNKAVCDNNTCVECATSDDCTDATRNTCNAGVCVECASSFDCKTAALPVCGDAGLCVAAVSECTGDDANEQNDGPIQAKSIDLDTEVAGGICQGTSGGELDYYLVNTTAIGTINIAISWTGDASLGVHLEDSTGAVVGDFGSDFSSTTDSWSFSAAPAGRYYVVVTAFDTSAVGGGGAAVPYKFTTTVVLPECTEDAECTTGARTHCDTSTSLCVECLTDLDCSAAGPQCRSSGADGRTTCQATDACTGDDARENGDDGPMGATMIAIGDTKSDPKVCGATGEDSSTEADWYVITIGATDNATATLTWTGDSDLDLTLRNAELGFEDASFSSQPEEIVLQGLAAGTYYLVVESYDGNPTDAIPYTLSVTAN